MWPLRPSLALHSRRIVSSGFAHAVAGGSSLCDKQTDVSCALCQVLEKRQLGAHCPEETNKMSHRPDVMAASTEGCEGKRSWPGPVRRVGKSSLRRRLSVETRTVAWSVLAS